MAALDCRTEAEEAVVAGVAGACACERGLIAAVLTGSMARNEATVVPGPAGCTRVLGDAEFLLVYGRDAGLPAAAKLREAARRVEALLERRGVLCPVDLAAVHPAYLRELPPAIFTFELRQCGRVVWGDKNILDAIPTFGAEDIPLEDGFTLLCNRMVEQMAALCAEPTSGPRSEHLRYSLLKLYLDMGTSLALFAGCFVPGYRGRSDRLAALAKEPRSWPFPPAPFAARVAECTEWKLNAALPPTGSERALLVQAVASARALWRWELGILTGAADAEATDESLWRRWMRAQTLDARARGWAYALRTAGWWKGRRYWRRWLWRAGQGSPRRWIYGAASQLFFQVPALLDGAVTELPLSEWARYLPIPGDSAATSWRDLGMALSANYKQFLVGTRS